MPQQIMTAEGIRVDSADTASKPLVIDLDGTLLYCDLLFEAAAQFIRRNPANIFLLLMWLMTGIANLKHQLAARIVPAINHAPINEALVAYANAANIEGRYIVLATASNEAWARVAATRFSFIDEVIASCPTYNLKGHRKAEALAERFPQGYTYAGDAKCDLVLWRSCRTAIFAGRNGSVRRQLAKHEDIIIEADFSRARPDARVWIRALRLQQWAKNALIFIPMLLAGRLSDLTLWGLTIAGFVAMGLTASATYLLNDVLDIEDDRQHWQKRFRPIAAGIISMPEAAVACVSMLTIAFVGITLASGWHAALMLGCYCIATVAYSFGLKRVPIVDVVVLAGLFTLRLVFGADLAQVALSDWLLVFSMILFASLALAKRATELARHVSLTDSANNPGGRGYVVSDLSVITGIGTAAAVAAPVIMSLYLINEAFSATLYHHPKFLWCVPAVIALWLGRMWLLCGRGTMADDPVSFAVQDKVSIGLGLLAVAAFSLAVLP